MQAMKTKNTNISVAIPPAVWAIGFSQFLINVSSIIVFGFSAVYLKSILGVGTGWIGFLEGVVEGCSYLTKVLSGVFSDYLQRRKRIMVWGFALVLLSRPILAISHTFTTVFAARLMDRLGNGIQSTPRDALVGDIAPPSIKGSCYGLRQSLGTAGSFFGAIIGVIVMRLTCNNFHIVFWIATIPAALALIILMTAVKEPRDQDHNGKSIPHAKKPRNPIYWKDLKNLGRNYWILMIIAGLFMLSRLSEAMLVLHAYENFGLEEAYTPIVLMLYNGANSIASYPIGKLSDRINRYFILGMGFIVLILADIVLSSATNLMQMLFGVVLWGIQIGITQSMFLALIADIVPKKLRGTGFGFFYFITSLSLITASTVGGSIAQVYSLSSAYKLSSIIACIALASLVVWIYQKRKHPIEV